MSSEARLRVMECWLQARREYPDRPDAQKYRFVELMRENGHLVAGPKTPLPCGWAPKREGSADA